MRVRYRNPDAIITGGIGGMFQINRTRRISLRFHTSQETIFLRCIYIIDKSLLTLEIKLNRVGIVGITSYLEDWLSLTPSLVEESGVPIAFTLLLSRSMDIRSEERSMFWYFTFELPKRCATLL